MKQKERGERERDNTHRIARIGFFCHSFTSECTSVRTSMLNEEIKPPTGSLYKICFEDCWALLLHSIFTSAALRYFEFVVFMAPVIKLYQEQAMKGERTRDP